MKKYLLFLLLASISANAQVVVNKPIICGDEQEFESTVIRPQNYKQIVEAKLSPTTSITIWINESNTLLVAEKYPEGICVVTGGRNFIINDDEIKKYYLKKTY